MPFQKKVTPNLAKIFIVGSKYRCFPHVENICLVSKVQYDHMVAASIQQKLCFDFNLLKVLLRQATYVCQKYAEALFKGLSSPQED